MAPNIFIFEITLLHVSPSIWRIVEMNRNENLHMLHAVIQGAMGWKNAHLYSFHRGEKHNAVDYMLPEYADPDEVCAGNDPRNFKLKDLFKNEGDQLKYLYDFGDGWEHHITFRGRRYEKAMFGFPSLMAGARRCPPEDIGGPGGYAELLNAIETKNKSALKHYNQWLGYRYDPDDFDPDTQKIMFGKWARRIAREPRG